METAVMVVLGLAVVAGVVDYGILVYRSEAPSKRQAFGHALLWASPFATLPFLFFWDRLAGDSNAPPTTLSIIATAVVMEFVLAGAMSISVFRARGLDVRARESLEKLRRILRR